MSASISSESGSARYTFPGSVGPCRVSATCSPFAENDTDPTRSSPKVTSWTDPPSG